MAITMLVVAVTSLWYEMVLMMLMAPAAAANAVVKARGRDPTWMGCMKRSRRVIRYTRTHAYGSAISERKLEFRDRCQVLPPTPVKNANVPTERAIMCASLKCESLPHTAIVYPKCHHRKSRGGGGRCVQLIISRRRR